jgi:hypothetical protein
MLDFEVWLRDCLFEIGLEGVKPQSEDNFADAVQSRSREQYNKRIRDIPDHFFLFLEFFSSFHDKQTFNKF